MGPDGLNAGLCARVLSDLEALSREQEILIGVDSWEALEACTARAALLTERLAELCSRSGSSDWTSELRQRASTLVDRHQQCLARVSAAREQLRAELDGLDQLRTTAHAVLPRYHRANDPGSSGAHLTGAA